MEALSPIRLLPLFFWQGRNDDAHEREPDAEGLSQREAFPEDGKGEDKGEYGDEVAEEGDDARFKMLEREVIRNVLFRSFLPIVGAEEAQCGINN